MEDDSDPYEPFTVMKFGGSSVASPAAIRQVISVIQAEIRRSLATRSQNAQWPAYPAVVVSAAGDTTDHLLQILEHASRAETYLCCKAQDHLRTLHFCIAEDLLGPEQLATVDPYIRQVFRDLHVRMSEVCDGERRVTPELRDWVAAIGEDLSSRVVAAALVRQGVPAQHIDARRLILTDDRFTAATPRYWETYARIRWSVPFAARTHVVVVGGFIGATDDGRVTTLGRGGSDLTASILGAALNAGEIQVWKDVDGMLTWDPRLRAGAHRVTALSYEEAAALAHAGATVLHPETMEPARRLRIPIVIRNTFRPEVEGTRIHTGSRVITGVVKSMACRQNATVLEMRFSDSTDSQPAAAMQLFQKESSFRPLAASAGALHLEVPAEIPDPCNRFQHFGCAQIHVRTNHTIVTLVGEGVTATFVERHLSTYLRQIDAVLLPQNAGTCAVRILVPQHEFPRFAETCRRIFFAELDPRCFAEAEAPSAALHGHSQDALAQPATINRPAHANRPVAQIRPLLSAS